MPTDQRTMQSAYMEWVKTQTGSVKFNLANSGLMSYPLNELGLDFSSFGLSGPGAYGFPPLKSAIAMNQNVSEDCVTTALGTSGANWLAMAAVINPGDEVLIEYPSYPLLWETAKFLGASVKFLKRHADNHFDIDLNRIEHSLTPRTRLLVLTNLHNPSCRLTSQSDLRTIGQIASRMGARVLVDEVYMDLLGEHKPTSAFHLGGPFLATNSLTKVYGLSGLRCGWVLADPELTRRMLRLNDLFGVNNPFLTDQISCVAFQKLPQIWAWSHSLLAENISCANHLLAATPQLQSQPLEVGTVMFPKVDFSVDLFCHFLRERYDTVVTPGRFFGCQNHLRIGLGGDPVTVQEALTRLQTAVHEFVH